MWMHMSGARWEVEGRVEERINHALREAEQARLVRAARGARKRRTFGEILINARAMLRTASLRAGRLQLQEPTT